MKFGFVCCFHYLSRSLTGEFSPTTFIKINCLNFSVLLNSLSSDDSNSTVDLVEAELGPDKAACVEIEAFVALPTPQKKK